MSGSGRTGRKRPAVQFKVVQQSYEDRDYEASQGPKPVLVPAAVADRRYKKQRQSGPATSIAAASRRRGRDEEEDEEEDIFGDGHLDFNEGMPMDFSEKRNMLMTDDTKEGDEKLFEDQVECEFDENFIKQMMYGTPGGGGDDGDAGDDDDDKAMGEYPQHDTSKRTIDKQFERMMQEFDADEDINDPSVTDPRAMGPLQMDQYVNALEEFIESNAGISFETAEPLKNKGLINQLKHMALRQGVFDSNKDGVFVTTLLPDKKARFVEEYRRETEELKAQALARSKARQQERERLSRDGGGDGDGRQRPADDDGKLDDASSHHQQLLDEDRERFEVVELKQKEKMDCETVLTTYSTLYNHPNIIAVRKKIDPAKAIADERRNRQRAAQLLQKQQQMQHSGAAASADDDDDADGDSEDARAGIDLSDRPKDESPEEKKLRRQLVKQQQRERRAQKKELKTVYRDCSIKQGGTAVKEKQKRAQMSLSLVKGWA